MHEGIPILNFLVPKPFMHLTASSPHGVREGEGGARRQGPALARAHRRGGPDLRMATTCSSRSARRTRFPGSSATSASSSTSGPCPWSTRRRCNRRAPASSSAVTRPSVEEHHLGRRPRPRRGDFDLPAVPTARRARAAAADVNLMSQKDGHPRVELRQPGRARRRLQGPLKDLTIVLRKPSARADRSPFKEAQRCLNCDVETRVRAKLLHRVRRVRRHLPGRLHHVHRQRPSEEGSSAEAECARARPRAGTLRLARAQDGPHHGERTRTCACTAGCARALPDGRLDMQKFLLELTPRARMPRRAPAKQPVSA